MFSCAAPGIADRSRVPALTLAAIGLGCLLLAAVCLRAFGPRYRVARLLAASRQVSIGEAAELAAAARPVYVRVSGRISSAEEFPDEHDRPLVYRRRRIEAVDDRGRWQAIEEEREAVPFGVESRSDFIAIDDAALEEGLVVIPREADGRLDDLPADFAAGRDPATPARLVIEQVSAVEHATVAGVPALGPDGQPRMTAGLGRPLVMTTLELPAAMRLAARDRRRLATVTMLLLAAGAVFLLAALASLLLGWALPPPVAGQEPSPMLIDPLDPRAGDGGATIGAPLLAALVVIAIGLAATIATLVYVRLARRG
ncbi:MAG TPA: hypothetical protein VNW68_05320 [Candidatus Limnocylindria bacterium]|nr:hypothetical protein [Candidatus Limnocylindria bacterium]